MFQEGAAPVDETKTSSKLRRYRDTLSTSGLAIIVFGIWDIAKAILSSVYGANLQVNDEETMSAVTEAIREFGAKHETLLIILAFAVLVSLFLSVVLRYYVGLCAHAEARGKRKGWAYVVIAGIMAFMSAVLLLLGLMLSKNSFSLFRYIITGTIELTSLFAYIDLIRSAIIVKRLTRRQLEGR